MATENKQDKPKDRPFIKWLNKAGKAWKDFWDTPVTIQYAYSPHAVVGNGGTPFSTTQRRGDFATQTAAAIAIPATAAGVATVGVVPTLVGMGAGMGAGIAADVGGSKLVELAGGDENAQEMVGDIAGFTLGALAGGKATKVSTNYLNLWNSQLSPKSIYTSIAEGLTPTTTKNYGLVKYYGPTMGKTTAAKTNPKLVDFDDIVRDPIAKLAAKKGVTPRDLKIANDPDYISLLEAEVARWRMNPANAGKTLVISNKALSSATTGYNNQPSIPDKETFIARQVQRGGNREEAAAYYDALIENNPNLKIDNRFVSDIESGTRTAQISEVERLGIPKSQRHSIQKPSTAKYEAKLIGDNKVGVFDHNGNEIGHIQLRPTGNDLEVAYIGRNKEYTLPEGEKFQEIGFEAARQYASKLGKRLSTSDSFEHPQYQIPVIVEGFQTRPLKSKNRIHWNADPDDTNMDMAARIQVVKDRLQQQDPFLTFDDMEQAFELSNLGQQIPRDSRGNSVSIHSLPELYDYKGRFIKPKWWQYIEEDSQVSNVYDELLHGYDVPGFYESWIGKPKRNFGVKFHFKSGGTIHIKKKNRGKFTDYCGGKVTEECIRKGKNSSNPTTRKRANFAANARKWKHQDGGIINYLNMF